jgi:uncharacterized lipoprotein YmbA
MKEKASRSFLKKRTKEFLFIGARLLTSRRQSNKSFCFFFQKEAFLALLLAGCSSPDPTYYTLQPVPGTAVAVAPGSIEVRRPGLAGYLDRSDIVLKSAGYRLDVNSQLRWGEPLGDMIGRVLAQDLSQRLAGASVFTQSGAITTDAQARVEVDILNFDADAGGAVVLNAELAIERGTSHTPISTRHLSLTEQPAGPGAANLVASMSTLLGRLADQVATDIAAAPVRGAAPS